MPLYMNLTILFRTAIPELVEPASKKGAMRALAGHAGVFAIQAVMCSHVAAAYLQC